MLAVVLDEKLLLLFAVNEEAHLRRFAPGLVPRGLNANLVHPGIWSVERFGERRVAQKHSGRSAGFLDAASLGLHSGRGNAPVDRLFWIDSDDGPGGNLLGRGDVFFQQDRRQREHITDVVEAVAGVVSRKTAGRLI